MLALMWVPSTSAVGVFTVVSSPVHVQDEGFELPSEKVSSVAPQYESGTELEQIAPLSAPAPSSVLHQSSHAHQVCDNRRHF